jgi:hypothetical protein
LGLIELPELVLDGGRKKSWLVGVWGRKLVSIPRIVQTLSFSWKLEEISGQLTD